MTGDVRVILTAHLDECSRQIAAVRASADELRQRLALSAATWEPHDWSDFGKPLGGLDFQ